MRLLLTNLLLVLFSTLLFSNDNWQQRVDYVIDVTLSPATKHLEGEIQITYQNNSPDKLDTIWMHLWVNGYSKYNTALATQLLQHNDLSMDLLDKDQLGAIGKFDWKIEGNNVTLQTLPYDPDIGFIVLAEPLLTGKSIVIETPFKVKVPASVSRMATDGRYFAITQWYPKPAVYDENGWHPMPYLDQGEFYAEFGKYTVTINVPEEYIVAATGINQTESTVNAIKQYTFEQDNVHDFAWFASPDFKIISDEVTLDNGHKVDVHSYYITEEDRWNECHLFTKNALKFYSEKVGPYPYDVCTVVEGPLEAGGGMEYPMITIIKDVSDKSYFESTVAHEVGHNYWQGILASNERRFPWIDEGINTYYERRYNREVAINPFMPEEIVTKRKVANFLGVKHITLNYAEELILRHEEVMNRHQAVGTTSEEFTNFGYGLQTYVKAGQLIDYLEAYLGLEKFDACMQAFFREYQFKHISPQILQDHFEQCSGKDLSFFFKDWINTKAVTNGKIKGIQNEQGTVSVNIKQKGDIAIPLPVKAISKNGEQIIWTNAESSSTIEFEDNGITHIELDGENLALDINPSNNYFKTKGFKRIESFRPQLFGSIENERKSQLYFVPVVAGNTHDKFMLGMAFYNRVFPAKNLDWAIVPFYAFGSKQANGIFNISYAQNIRKDRNVTITYGSHFKTFSYNNGSSGGRYITFSPSIEVKILPENRLNNIEHTLYWKHHSNWKGVNIINPVRDTVFIDIDSFMVNTTLVSNKTYSPLWVEEIGYRFKRNNVKLPVNAAAKFQFNHEHAKISAETTIKARYGKIKSYASVRLWVSAVVYKMTDFATSNQLGFGTYGDDLAGTKGGSDYLFEHFYLGRSENEGFVSRQVFMDQGQFKSMASDLFGGNKITGALNIRADFPSKWIPIKLFADIGVISKFNGLEDVSTFAIQAGVMISVLDEAIEVYFPFFSSDVISEYYDLNASKYKQRITFSFNLDKLNPHKIVKEMEF